jgi:hypothetical protein
MPPAHRTALLRILVRIDQQLAYARDALPTLPYRSDDFMRTVRVIAKLNFDRQRTEVFLAKCRKLR